MVKITVRNGNVEQALRVMKKKVAKEGLIGENKKRERYIKPTEVRKEKFKEAVRRRKKEDYKRKIFFGS